MQDFLIDIDGDISIINGDFVLGTSDKQHAQLLLTSEKGAWKENPDKGVGALKYLESEDAAGLLREIRQQYTADGMTVNKLNLSATGTLDIDASYKQ